MWYNLQANIGGKKMRHQVTLKCAECGEENYITTRNRSIQQERMEVTKYCPKDRKHTVHKEKK